MYLPFGLSLLVAFGIIFLIYCICVRRNNFNSTRVQTNPVPMPNTNPSRTPIRSNWTNYENFRRDDDIVRGRNERRMGRRDRRHHQLRPPRPTGNNDNPSVFTITTGNQMEELPPPNYEDLFPTLVVQEDDMKKQKDKTSSVQESEHL